MRIHLEIVVSALGDMVSSISPYSLTAPVFGGLEQVVETCKLYYGGLDIGSALKRLFYFSKVLFGRSLNIKFTETRRALDNGLS